MNYDISIIVPIYKVEQYIEQCAKSLFDLDYKSVEYIFVNDCTPDQSMQILDKVIENYPNRQSSIKIIHHEINQGSGIARKTGIEHATGEYTIYIDSDDWIEPDMASSFMNEAKETGADIVISDFYENYPNSEIYKKQTILLGSNKLYIKEILTTKLRSFMWNKLVRTQLYKNIKFPNYSIGEDVFICIQLFFHANKIAYLSKAVVHYRTNNTESLTKNFNIENIFKYCKSCENLLKDLKIWNEMKDFLYGRLLYSCLSNFGSQSREYLIKYFPEADKVKYLWKSDAYNTIKKFAYTLIFYRFDFLFKLLRVVYRKIKFSK